MDESDFLINYCCDCVKKDRCIVLPLPNAVWYNCEYVKRNVKKLGLGLQNKNILNCFKCSIEDFCDLLGGVICKYPREGFRFKYCNVCLDFRVFYNDICRICKNKEE
jgi:hypothetical protein